MKRGPFIVAVPFSLLLLTVMQARGADDGSL